MAAQPKPQTRDPQKKNAGDGDELQEIKTSKKKLIFIILGAASLVLGAGIYCGTAWFMRLPPFTDVGPSAEQLAVAETAREAEEAQAPVKDVFIKFDAPFDVALTDGRRKHHGRVEVTLRVIGDENEALAKQHQALLGSVVFAVLADQDFEMMIRSTGREHLKSILLEQLRNKMEDVAQAPVVEQVLFTGYVMQ